jgi:hypothetical protein
MSTRVARSTTLAAFAAAATLSLAPQGAEALQFQFNNSINSRSVEWSRDNPPGPGTGAKTGTSNAGAFSMTERTPATDVPPPFFGENEDFVAWCFDLDTTISGGTFTYSEAPGLLNSEPPYQTPDALARIEKLFDSSYDSLRGYGWWRIPADAFVFCRLPGRNLGSTLYDDRQHSSDWLIQDD